MPSLRNAQSPKTMLSEYNPALAEAFLEVARRRRMLSEDQLNELAEVCAHASVMPGQLAVEMDMLAPVDVEIIEAFLAPKDLAPGYELLDVVGYGALGVVYRARQPHLQRDVAIKAILQSRLSQQNVVARFQQEGALIGRLQHPNIVSAYDFGSHRNRLYLVMELVSGVDLSRRLDKGPIPILHAISIVRQTALGLAHAFSHHIIHRDIKPGNLLLTEAPAGFDLPPGVPLVKIADFGIARFQRSAEFDDQDTRLTVTGAALGTPMYCAPEQLSGDEIDHRSDIYALGATLFRLLSGDAPFAPDKVSKIIAAKVTGQLPRVELLPANLDPEVKQLMLDMMKSDPDQRIPDYETLIARIDSLGSMCENIVSGRGTQRPSSSVTPSGKRGVNRQTILAFAAMLLLGMTFITLTRWWTPPPIPTMILSGWEDHLFDGKTITGWSVRSGLWKSGVDKEGGAILIGKGSAIRPLPPPPPSDLNREFGIGVRVGIDLQEAAAAEIHFGFHGQDVAETPRGVVQLTAREVSLGTKSSVDAEFQSWGSMVQVPTDDGEEPRYHEVRVERQATHWFAFFDDQNLGSLPVHSQDNDRVVQLVTNGTVHFEGPLVYQLTQPAGTSE